MGSPRAFRLTPFFGAPYARTTGGQGGGARQGANPEPGDAISEVAGSLPRCHGARLYRAPGYAAAATVTSIRLTCCAANTEPVRLKRPSAAWPPSTDGGRGDPLDRAPQGGGRSHC